MADNIFPPTAAGGFTDRLRAAIGDSTLRTFAARVGISTSALHQYLTGKSEPSRPVLLALAGAAGVRLEWLAGGEAPGTDPAVRETAPSYAATPGRRERTSPAVFDPDLLQAVMAAADEVLLNRGITLPAEKKSRLTALIYEDAWRRGGEVRRDYVEKLVELAR